VCEYLELVELTVFSCIFMIIYYVFLSKIYDLSCSVEYARYRRHEDYDCHFPALDSKETPYLHKKNVSIRYGIF